MHGTKDERKEEEKRNAGTNEKGNTKAVNKSRKLSK
jgi:hypothetical protein